MKKPLAAAGLALAVFTVLPTPADARRHRHGYGYYWHVYHHRSPRARFARVQPSDGPAEKPDPAAVYGPPQPRPLYIVRTIVNGSLPWSGPPPAWAGELHVSPILSGRSAYVRR